MTSTALVAGERVDTETGEVLPGTPEEQNTDDVIRSEHLAASVAEHNPTFDRHEASTVPLADEMSVGGYDD